MSFRFFQLKTYGCSQIHMILCAEVVIERVGALYDNAVKMFSNSSMLWVQNAAFNLFYRRSYYRTHHCLETALNNKPRPDEMLLIKIIR